MPSLTEFMAALAAYVARERGWSLEDATRWIEVRMAEAHEEYRQAGAPLGDSDEGFLAWLSPRHQPPTA
ncbi:MAG TPA: hypothetical protein VFU22_30320 [Roseiflexaceae bacterium]|nr:hypothetical protein [Roseiflexaceae bacterium]